MDKFLIKIPRETSLPVLASPKPQKKELKQAKIESLQRVVVVEDILRMKAVLELENQTEENLLKALQELRQKTPSREILSSTKIGHTLNTIRKHSSKEVAALAKDIRNDWKKFIKDRSDKGIIEVRSDAKTEKQRSAGKRLLAGVLEVAEDSKLVENIEREVYHRNKRILNNNYRRTMRTLIFAVKHKNDIRTKVQNGHLSIQEFIDMHKR
uniref:Transcription elongation factor A N-terminal and central domain-containing protein 2-like n=1 Tax=Saccoglossus kowalevskii TaxID=10224 RepID=A0ABM0GII6_SACKO|nr:PREDICTED: transcription elongation factor A N-terminal and central domain-containing protein 2-like [Saccoglossus kowalevskii]